MKKRGIAGKSRRTLGWIISLGLLAGFYSPQAELLRSLPNTLVVAVGQQAEVSAAFPLRLTIHEKGMQTASDAGESLSAKGVTADERTVKPGTATATISLMGLFPLREVQIDIRDDLNLYPGGQSVGVALHTEGVLVVGTSDLSDAISPARAAGLKAGDVITQAGGKTLQGTEELTALVEAARGKPLPLQVKRGDGLLNLTLEPKLDSATGTFRIGAWVRDSTAGIGTLSFYGEVTAGEGARYGALGHAITDADTQQVLTISKGEMMTADIVDVRKGQPGVPGELKGSFLRERRVLGSIRVNNVFGIYGPMEQESPHPLYPEGLPIGRKDAVHTGPATILCTVGAEGMKEYAVEIVEVARQTAPAQRSMVIRVTDPELLSKTGGIVQGMSGSPILQDGRLIGAVTHV